MTRMVMWIVNNWDVILGLIALVVVVILAVRAFVKLPTSAQKEKVRKCLLAWVIQAEKELGGGTGRVKLSTVYGTFVTAFPILKNFISFETFSEWVDDALDEMRKLLEQNENLKQVVEGIQLEVGEAIMAPLGEQN